MGIFYALKYAPHLNIIYNLIGESGYMSYSKILFRMVVAPAVMAGILLFLAQTIAVHPILRYAETFENQMVEDNEQHDEILADDLANANNTHIHEDGKKHIHADQDAKIPDDTAHHETQAQNSFNWVALGANIGFSLGYAAILWAISLIITHGDFQKLQFNDGLKLGLLGFLSFNFVPNLFFPIALPTLKEFDYQLHNFQIMQYLYFACVIFALIGNFILFYGKNSISKIIILIFGFGLLIFVQTPPENMEYSFYLPAELARNFAVISSGINCGYFLLLGALMTLNVKKN